MKIKLQHVCILLALFAGIHQADAQGTTAFTYQGQLHDSSTNANGTYTMIFALYDSVSGGNQIGSNITTSPTLANGLFSVNLDFGNVFNGNARWLDITITSGSTTQELSPRVQVLPTPYAQFAAVAATVTNGAIMNAQLAGSAVNTTNIQNNAITTNQIASGQVVKSLNGLMDNVVLSAGTNITITPNGQTLTIGSTGGGSTVTTATNAANLTNATWNTSVGTFSGINNVFLLSNSNTPVMALGQVVPGKYGVISEGGLSVVGYGGGTGSYGISLENGNVDVQTGDVEVYQGNIDVDLGSVSVKAGNVIVGGNVSANDVYGNNLVYTSDRNAKEQFIPVNSSEVLERVVGLPISSWDFKTDAKTRHIGPMAQDFYSAFNVGADDKHIATVDETGVALAAIQGLNQKLDEKDEELQKLKSQNVSLEKRLADLEQLVKASTQK